MSDLDIAVEKVLDEDDDVELENKQDAMDWDKSPANSPTNKIPGLTLGEVTALLREAVRLHATQNAGLGIKSKEDVNLSLISDSASYSTNSVRLVADRAKSCYSSKNVSNTLTADSAIPCDINSGIQCANENSDEDYLNHILLEYENTERRESPLNEKLTKTFQDLIWNNAKPEKIEYLLKSVLSSENIEGLEPNKVNIEIWRTISHQTKSVDLKLQNMQALEQKSFTVIANMADELLKNRTEKDES